MLALLSSPVAAHASVFVPEGGRAARPSPPGALRAAWTARPSSHKPGHEFRTFTLAVNAKDAQGQPITRWHRCIDWRGLTATYRKGDRVALTGFFKVRKYEKDGETKEVRELVVTDARLERIKVREQAA